MRFLWHAPVALQLTLLSPADLAVRSMLTPVAEGGPVGA